MTGLWTAVLLAFNLLLSGVALAAGPYSVHLPASSLGVDPQAVTVIGHTQEYEIQKGDTLLDIARDYGLGYLELGQLYRHWDPFLPPVGERITIPTTWIVPDSQNRQLIVNTGEMRLYKFADNAQKVYTFPIGMGVLDFKTPTGIYKVTEKKVKPPWYVPKSLQAKYGMAVMPPGPDNPLGDYKLTLSWGDYGIHGTHMPWGVGRLVSHGCTRMYPEHIKELFPMVSVGTVVEYIYEPVKIGFRQGRIYLEVNEDFYHRIPDMLIHTLNKLEDRGLITEIDYSKVVKIVEEKLGMPEEITKKTEGVAATSLTHTLESPSE
ncbi:MAG: L,D-transpeptidase family protein [Desulfobacca sp.]|nr:L,D-transpeptidase family protein [Desulfobacca sp.]